MTYRFPDVLLSRASFRLSVSQVDSRVILRGSTFKLPSFRLLLLPSYLDARRLNVILACLGYGKLSLITNKERRAQLFF